MALYQPQQGLTWKYVNASGQLIIMAKIYVELGVNEKVTASVSSIYKNACTITLFVETGVNNSPITVPVYYTNIGPNLQTVEVVQDHIEGLEMVTVRTRIYKDNVFKDEVINSTTTSSQVVIE